MNTYIAQIIQLLIFNNGEVTFNFLMEQLHISKRMIDYYLKQFDVWRQSVNFPQIQIEDDKVLLVCKDYEKFFNEFVENYDVENYFLSAPERQGCIVLLIGLGYEKIKIEYIVEWFKVSKNTITNDLLTIKEKLSKYGVSIESKGKSGYYLKGNEQDIRYVLMQCYHYYENSFFHKYKREHLLGHINKYGMDTTNIVTRIHDVLMEAEKQDNEDYIFLALHDLIETILLVVCRMQKAQINSIEKIPDAMVNTLALITSRFETLGITYSEAEKDYLYLILQSAKVSCYNPNDFSEEVVNLTNDIIYYFKSISQLNIFEQSEIYNMFLIHVKSMYFRTKHKIKITNFSDTAISGLYGFYCIAKKVLAKVQSKYALTYDDDEVKFLSYYFASLEYANEPSTDEMGNIVIVCVAGLGSSMYLKSQCLKIFDNAFTITISDLKNLNDNMNEDTKLIVSTIHIDSALRHGASLKRVHPVLTDKEKQELTEWFFMNRFSLNKESEVIRDVMDIIKECTVIKDQQKLFHELNHYFNPVKETPLLHLKDIFNANSIRSLSNLESLEQFIYEAGKPLLDSSMIQKSYLDNIINVLNQHGPYCECFDGILVAHAVPENDVQRPCLSLGFIKDGFVVPRWKNKVIKAIFILGVTDTESHGNAFSELIRNLTKDNLYQQINEFEDCQLLYNRITESHS